MKRFTRWIGCALVVFAAGLLILVQADVKNSAHNLSSTAGTNQITDKSTDEDEICVFCHTPHSANPSAPLWNHTLSGTASYGVYSSSTLDATDITDIGGGTDISNLCMSCHDGTVGVNDLVNFSFGGTAKPTMGNSNELDVAGKLLSTNSANFGTSLSDDHPINFTYSISSGADPDIVTAAFVDQFVDAAKKVPLFSGKVQCASCHEPHDNTNQPFLVLANTGSALCLTCHTK